MSLARKLFLPVAAMLALAACAAPFRADVARFQQMPAPQGQSFYVQAADPAKAGGLEFQTYANLVAIEMEQLGYRRAAGPEAADLAVTLDYAVDTGRDRIVTHPTAGYYASPFHDPWFWGRRWHSPYYWGWHDPWFGGFGTETHSFTLYTSGLDLDITRTADGLALFDGRARARSRDDDLTVLVPNLVEAMFTGFPGNSGEEVRITIALPEDDG